MSLKSCIQETLNILMCAKKTQLQKKNGVGGVRGGEGLGWDDIAAWLRGDDRQTHRQTKMLT